MKSASTKNSKILVGTTLLALGLLGWIAFKYVRSMVMLAYVDSAIGRVRTVISAQSDITDPYSGSARPFSAPNGKTLYVSQRKKDGNEALALNLQGHKHLIWQSATWPPGVVPSPDGRHLAIIDWKRDANMWMMENF